jgi:hypothetical protein
MMIFALALRAVLIGVFLWAAMAKLSRLGQFSAYLTVPFRNYAPYVARATIAVEIAVAIAGAVPLFRIWWPAATSAILIALSGFYAVRLNLSDETSCACWGMSTPRGESPYAQILAPAWVGLRNMLLTFAALLAAMPQAGQSAVSACARDLLIASSTVCLIVAGLAVSWIRLRTRPVERWRALYAARWHYLRKGSCQVTGTPIGQEQVLTLGRLNEQGQVVS